MMILHNLINEAEFKLESLPQGYFIEYFERTFLPQLKEINKKLEQKCYIQADSLKEAELINEFRKII